MQDLIADLQKYQASRKYPDWKPTPSGTVNFTNSTNTQVVKRALDFLPLELQVAVWDDEASQAWRESAEVRAILERNAADERKHDEALRFLSQHYNKRGFEDEREANELIQRWQVLSELVHPIVAMYTLEMGVFFAILPTLTLRGDVYASTVAAWISDDERVHAESGLRLMKQLKLKLTQECLELVRDTILYIFAPLGQAQAMEQAKRALKRLTSGKDAAMLRESVPVTIAYFEQTSKQAIVY